MNSNYKRGARLEYEIIDTLTEQGYRCMRAAGSHGFADVIAVSDKEARFIQAKTTETEFAISRYRKDIDKFVNVVLSDQVTKELWVKIMRKGTTKILIL